MADTWEAECLLLELIRLARAQFDMRCACSMADRLLASPDNTISADAYGTFGGLAIAYARPFSKSFAYGALGREWRRFPEQPALRAHHRRLIGYRNRLLAHNDLSAHRRTFIWTPGAFHPDKPSIVEARSPIMHAGVRDARKLAAFQEARFGERAQSLTERLQELLNWPAATELDLDKELERLRPKTHGGGMHPPDWKPQRPPPASTPAPWGDG